MTDSLRWHTEVRGRSDAELRDKLALQDHEAQRRGYVRVEQGEPRTDGPETVWPLVYEQGRREFTTLWKVILLAALIAVVFALWQGGYRG